MKLMKRVTALFLCFLILTSGPISAFATEGVSDNDVVVETTTTIETEASCEECGGSDAHTDTCSLNTINTLNTEAPAETAQPTTAPTEAPTENTQPTTTPVETTGDTVSGNDAGCTECGETEGHLDTCSQYVAPTEETTEPTTTPTESTEATEGDVAGCTECGQTEGHLETCSQYVAPGCTECGETEGHLGTCSQYIDPNACAECKQVEGHAETCSQYEAPKDELSEITGPQVGDKIWIKSGSNVYKTQSNENGHQLLWNYEVEIVDVITDETGAVVWYEFKFASLGIGEIILRNYKYVHVDSTSVEEPAETEPVDENACNCGEDAPENLADHADSCPRKQYVKTLFEGKTAEEIYAEWENYDEATQTDLLNMLQKWDNEKYEELEKLVDGTPDGEKETTVDGIRLKVQGVPENVTLGAETVIPKSFHEDLFDVIGSKKIVFAIDITLADENGEWQPAEGQSVTVSLDAASLGLSEGERIGILHDHNGSLNDLGICTVTDGKLTFTTDGFSVFYGYTVDFEYDGTWHSIEGGSGIYLSQLFIMLGIDRSANDVVSVDFTDTSLLTAVRESRDIEVGGGYDWHLQSLQAFDTEETLTITFGDGEVIVINVYDARTITSLSTTGNWSTDAQLGANINITLTGNINMTNQIAVPAGYTLTIDGDNKYSIKLNADGITMFDVKGTLILKNVVLDGGTVWSSGSYGADRTHFHVDRGDTPTGKTGGRFVVVSGSGTLTATNTTFQNLYSTKTPLNLSGNGNMTLTSCTIQDCECNADGGVINASNDGEKEKATLYINGNSIIQRCAATGNSYGGVIRTSGGSKIIITIDTFTMQQCYSIRWGCILWNSRTGTCTITNSTFKDNFSELRGGAISSEAHSLSLTNCTFQNNESGLYGGAIAVFPYTLSTDTEETTVEIKVNIGNGCKFIGNKAVSGGALAILLYPSNAALEGADKRIYNVTTIIDLGTDGYIKENSALTKTVNRSDYAEQAQEFVDKASPVNGTGNGGGIFIETTHKNYLSTLQLNSGLIQDNQAEYGAGAYVTNTNVTFGAITVDRNEARSNGGGLYMKQDDAKNGKAVTTVSNGTITNNKAEKNGGGIYQTGTQGECTVSGNGTISGNTAANGGGIYIAGGSKLAVTGGIITNNHAVGSSNATTAKDATCGVGGGIYVHTGEFRMSGDNVGLHSNDASVAADDAYATGGTATNLTLPNVEDMNLTGWSGAVQPEGWFADYKAEDPNYPSEVIVVDGKNTTNPGRYDYYDEDKVEVDYTTVLSQNANTYYCLTIGTPHPGYGNLVITKTLTAPAKETQTFIFEVTGTTRKPETAYFLTVTLVIERGETKAQVLVANIPDGTYTVTEKEAWSWRYDQTSREFHPKDGAVISETTFTVAIENPEWVADFANKRTDPFWLSGDSYCENWWGGTGETKIEKREEHE